MIVVRVVLVGLTDAEREDFVREDVAGYAEQLAAQRTMSPGEAADRAESELGPRLRQEHASAVANSHQRWTALSADGASVGWLWVTPPEADMPLDSAFLYQILVKPASRRQGYGLAMLAALEQSLAGNGIVEVRLNVFDTNQRARPLYATAGYELVKPLNGMSQLRKRLTVNDQY